jgi:hypothetical protein
MTITEAATAELTYGEALKVINRACKNAKKHQPAELRVTSSHGTPLIDAHGAITARKETREQKVFEIAPNIFTDGHVLCIQEHSPIVYPMDSPHVWSSHEWSPSKLLVRVTAAEYAAEVTRPSLTPEQRVALIKPFLQDR